MLSLSDLRSELAALESQTPEDEGHACEMAMRVSALKLMIMLRLFAVSR